MGTSEGKGHIQGSWHSHYRGPAHCLLERTLCSVTQSGDWVRGLARRMRGGKERAINMCKGKTNFVTDMHTHTGKQSHLPDPQSNLQGALYFWSPSPLPLVTVPWHLLCHVPLSFTSPSALWKPAPPTSWDETSLFSQSVHLILQPSGLFRDGLVAQSRL